MRILALTFCLFGFQSVAGAAVFDRSPSYGDQGRSEAVRSTSDGPIYDLAVDAQGRSYLLFGPGTTCNAPPGVDCNDLDSPPSEVVRLTAAGALDSSFAQNGRLLLPPQASFFRLDIDNQKQRLLLSGFPDVGANPAVEARRFSGTIDTGFGSNGTTTLPVLDNAIGDLLVAGDGYIYVSGTYSMQSADGYRFGASIARLDRDGRFDSSFGSGGVRHYLNPALWPNAPSLALDEQGRLLIYGSGFRMADNESVLYVARLSNSSDSADSSFGVNGLAFLSSQSNDRLAAVVTRRDGDLVLISSQNNGMTLRARRLRADGSIDSSFDVSGSTRNDENVPPPVITQAAMLPDGKIMVGVRYVLYHVIQFAGSRELAPDSAETPEEASQGGGGMPVSNVTVLFLMCLARLFIRRRRSPTTFAVFS